MKPFFCILLAVILCTTSGFAADKTQAASGISDNSLVEIGKTYSFVIGPSANIIAKVIKRLNDNWILVENPDDKSQFLINLRATFAILPYKPDNH